MMGQIGQGGIGVKRSIEKINAANQPVTVVNTGNGTSSGVVHLLRHHNRAEEAIGKPQTAGGGIGVLNQRFRPN